MCIDETWGSLLVYCLHVFNVLVPDAILVLIVQHDVYNGLRFLCELPSGAHISRVKGGQKKCII